MPDLVAAPPQVQVGIRDQYGGCCPGELAVVVNIQTEGALRRIAHQQQLLLKDRDVVL
jgi:hypothetical protein